MPTKIEEKIWREVLKLVKKEIGTQEFNTWLSGTNLRNGNGSDYSVEVPNEKYLQYINSNYLGILEEKLSSLSAKQATIRLEISPNQEDLFFDDEEEEAVITSESLAPGPRPSNLNEAYVFDAFVVGRSNSFCDAAARAIADSLGNQYNPFFVYGDVGLGKTHLLQAIGHLALAKDKGCSVAYLSADQFMNEMIEAIKANRPEDFRRKYRKVDLLLVDDIHFWGGREGTQEEFFHTFNALHQAGKQIVVSSDRLPRDLPNFTDRLRTRFEWGLIADIQKPDYEMRMAIIEKKTEERGIELTREVTDIIATNITSNIRAIEGIIIRLQAISHINKKPINIEMAQTVLSEMMSNQRKPTSIEKIQELTADYFSITKRDLVSKSRRARLAKARHVAIYLAREKGKAILADIGAAFGNRDHTTVLNSIRVIENLLQADDGEIKRALADIGDKLERTY